MTQEELEQTACFSIKTIKETLGDKITSDMKILLVAKAIEIVDVPKTRFTVDETAELLKDAPDPFAGMNVPAEEPEVWTDETIMTYGRYKGQKLANIPKEYLIWLFENNRTIPILRTYIINSFNL